MATVSAPPRARRERPSPSPAPSIERHGTTRLYIEINRQLYKLRKVRPLPAGIAAAWGVVKIDHDRAEPVAYAVASDGLEIKCTCSDHSINGAECKHIRSLIAQGLIDRPGPAEPVAESPAPAPAESPADQFRGAVRAEVARLAPSPLDFDNRVIDRTAHILPEGWQPGGAPAPAPSPAKAKAKTRRPKGPKCLECGRPISAAPSPDPAFCAPCYHTISGEGGAR